MFLRLILLTFFVFMLRHIDDRGHTYASLRYGKGNKIRYIVFKNLEIGMSNYQGYRDRTSDRKLGLA